MNRACAILFVLRRSACIAWRREAGPAPAAARAAAHGLAGTPGIQKLRAHKRVPELDGFVCGAATCSVGGSRRRCRRWCAARASRCAPSAPACSARQRSTAAALMPGGASLVACARCTLHAPIFHARPLHTMSGKAHLLSAGPKQEKNGPAEAPPRMSARRGGWACMRPSLRGRGTVQVDDLAAEHACRTFRAYIGTWTCVHKVVPKRRDCKRAGAPAAGARAGSAPRSAAW